MKRAYMMYLDTYDHKHDLITLNTNNVLDSKEVGWYIKIPEGITFAYDIHLGLSRDN